MDNPSVLVSVIIPNYNHAKYLQQRIDSVLNQTFQDFELIILDDKSTDNSSEVINLYKNHPKTTYCIVNEVNSGSTFRQWYKGINLAKGKYIWIAESDDSSSDTLLQTAVQALETNESVGIAYCGSHLIDSDYNIVNTIDHYPSDFSNTVLRGKDQLVLNFTFGNNIWNASAAVFRKSTLPVHYSQFDKFKYYGDWSIYVDILSKADLYYINQPLNHFRVNHSVRVTSASEKSGLEIRESYAFYGDLNNQISIPKHSLLKIKNILARKWANKLFTVRNGVKLSTHYQILNSAIQLDWFVLIRVLLYGVKKAIIRR